ncbi:NAD(P)-binding oxidoreductase [uncultured Arcticibacterium sp.]|uniref:NAD(P)-dependent oxidoreductase n=1 Tax=uncultured Arcticibacterium sp. TaxID=2173042 RepID=UPI0030F8EE20
MSILVVGASGATGKLLVEKLLSDGHQLKIVVRTAEKLPDSWKSNAQLTIITASLLDLNNREMVALTANCYAVASCLGHNMSIHGIYGQPRKLVTEATKRLCAAIKVNKPEEPIKFVLMNTTGNRNRDLDEPISFAQKCIVGLIRFLVPPHADNESAAEYLRTVIDQNSRFVEWAVVRPDSLIDNSEVSPYEVHPSPTRSAIFDAGKTSRINVGHFMASLITDNALWNQWKGQMPVIYNKES